MGFMDENYLFGTEKVIAKKIFEKIKDLPILDAHNHANVKEIARNERYIDIWEVEGATDHYVWEMMRKRGISEDLITGNAKAKEKWFALSGIFEDLVGNPCYEWIHLDLKYRLGIDKLINKENAESIWIDALTALMQPKKTPQDLLREMNVEVMCSTDDPIDLLEDHKKLAKVPNLPKILPTWRPDKAMNIFKPDFNAYIEKLEKRVQKKISNINELVLALKETHDYFASVGCVASDHGIETPFGFKVSRERADNIFMKRRAGGDLDTQEVRDYISFMMHQFGYLNKQKNWVTQIHIGAVRDVRDSLFESIGPDSGGDVSNHLIEILNPLKDYLNTFDNKLKVILYSLDPNHVPTLATLTRSFGEKVSLGSAWWYNDSPIGMKRQLEYIGSVDLLMNFAGMVSDSRKLMSYGSRTEMFRRVLSDVLSEMVGKGQMPEHLAIRLAKHICYDGPKKLFGF
jgi:glucuronate isomerase